MASPKAPASRLSLTVEAPSVAPTSVLDTRLMVPGSAPELSWIASAWALAAVKPPVMMPVPPQISLWTLASSTRSLSMKIAILFSGWPCGWLTRSRVSVQNKSLPFELKENCTSGRFVLGSVDREALVTMLPSMFVNCGLNPWYLLASVGFSSCSVFASAVPGTHSQMVR